MSIGGVNPSVSQGIQQQYQVDLSQAQSSNNNSDFEALLSNAITSQGFQFSAEDAAQMQQLIQGFAQDGMTIEDFASTTLSTSVGDVLIGDLDIEGMANAIIAYTFEGADAPDLRAFFQLPAPAAAPSSLAADGQDVSAVDGTQTDISTRNVVTGIDSIRTTGATVGITDETPLVTDNLLTGGNPSGFNFSFNTPAANGYTLGANDFLAPTGVNPGNLTLTPNAFSLLDPFSLAPLSLNDPFSLFSTMPSLSENDSYNWLGMEPSTNLWDLNYGTGFSSFSLYPPTSGYRDTEVTLDWTGGPDYSSLESQSYDQLRAADITSNVDQLNGMLDAVLAEKMESPSWNLSHMVTRNEDGTVTILDPNVEIDRIQSTLAEHGLDRASIVLSPEEQAMLEQHQAEMARIDPSSPDYDRAYAEEHPYLDTEFYTNQINNLYNHAALDHARALYGESNPELYESLHSDITNIHNLQDFNRVFMDGPNGYTALRENLHTLAAYDGAGGSLLAYTGNQEGFLTALEGVNQSFPNLQRELASAGLSNDEVIAFGAELQSLESQVSTLHQVSTGSTNLPQSVSEMADRLVPATTTAQFDVMNYTNQLGQLTANLNEQGINTERVDTLLAQFNALPIEPFTPEHQRLMNELNIEVDLLYDSNDFSTLDMDAFMQYFDVTAQGGLAQESLDAAVSEYQIMAATLDEASSNIDSLVRQTENEIAALNKSENPDSSELERLNGELASLQEAQAVLTRSSSEFQDGFIDDLASSADAEMLDRILPNATNRLALQQELVGSNYQNIVDLVDNNQNVQALRAAIAATPPLAPFNDMDPHLRTNLQAILVDPQGFTDDINTMLLDPNITPDHKQYLRDMMTGVDTLLTSVGNASSVGTTEERLAAINTAITDVGSDGVSNNVDVLHSIVDANFLRLEYSNPSTTNRDMVSQPGQWINTLLNTGKAVEYDAGVALGVDNYSIQDRSELLTLIEARLVEQDLMTASTSGTPALVERMNAGDVMLEQAQFNARQQMIAEADAQMYQQSTSEVEDVQDQSLKSLDASMARIHAKETERALAQSELNDLRNMPEDERPSDYDSQVAQLNSQIESLDRQINSLVQSTISQFSTEADPIGTDRASLETEYIRRSAEFAEDIGIAHTSARTTALTSVGIDATSSLDDLDPLERTMVSVTQSFGNGMGDSRVMQTNLAALEVLEDAYSRISQLPSNPPDANGLTDEQKSVLLEDLASRLSGRAGQDGMTIAYREFLTANNNITGADGSTHHLLRSGESAISVSHEIYTTVSTESTTSDISAELDNRTDNAIDKDQAEEDIEQVGGRVVLERYSIVTDDSSNEGGTETSDAGAPPLGMGFQSLTPLSINTGTPTTSSSSEPGQVVIPAPPPFIRDVNGHTTVDINNFRIGQVVNDADAVSGLPEGRRDRISEEWAAVQSIQMPGTPPMSLSDFQQLTPQERFARLESMSPQDIIAFRDLIRERLPLQPDPMGAADQQRVSALEDAFMDQFATILAERVHEMSREEIRALADPDLESRIASQLDGERLHAFRQSWAQEMAIYLRENEDGFANADERVRLGNILTRIESMQHQYGELEPPVELNIGDLSSVRTASEQGLISSGAMSETYAAIDGITQLALSDISHLGDLANRIGTFNDAITGMAIDYNRSNCFICERIEGMAALTDMMKNGLNEELLAALDDVFANQSQGDSYTDATLSAAAEKNAAMLRAEDAANATRESQIFADAAARVEQLTAELRRDMAEIMEKFNQEMLANMMAELIGRMVDEHIYAVNWEKSIEQIAYHEEALQAVATRAAQLTDVLSNVSGESDAEQFLTEITSDIDAAIPLVNQINNGEVTFSDLSADDQLKVTNGLAAAAVLASLQDGLNPGSSALDQFTLSSSVETNSHRRFDDDLIAQLIGRFDANLEAQGLQSPQFSPGVVFDPLSMQPIDLSGTIA